MAIGNPCKIGDLAIIINCPPELMENLGKIVKVRESRHSSPSPGCWGIESIGGTLIKSFHNLFDVIWLPYCEDVPDADLLPLRNDNLKDESCQEENVLTKPETATVD